MKQNTYLIFVGLIVTIPINLFAETIPDKNANKSDVETSKIARSLQIINQNRCFCEKTKYTIREKIKQLKRSDRKQDREQIAFLRIKQFFNTFNNFLLYSDIYNTENDTK